MLFDAVVIIILCLIAAALGLTVHPWLWAIAIIALIWLLARPGTRRGNRTRL